MKRFTFIFLGIAFVVFLAYSFKPITAVKTGNSIKISGKVVSMKKDASNTIQIRLENDSHYYYIPHDVNLAELSSKVLNKTVTLHLPKLWVGTSEHIAQLEVDHQVLFTEFN